MIDEIKLTKNLIKINSTNPGKYEKEVFKFLENLLKKEGIKYKKYLLHKDRPNLVIKIGNKKFETLHFNFSSLDKSLDKDKKLNTDIWYEEKTLNWVKASFKKKGDWEYRLISIK